MMTVACNAFPLEEKAKLFCNQIKAADTKSELVFLTFCSQQTEEVVSLGEALDAGRQVGVRLAVAGNSAAEPWDDMPRVKVIDRPD